MVVRDSQCTGASDFQGENNPDADPNFNPDCDTEEQSNDRALPIGPGNPPGALNAPVQQVRVSEL